MTRFLLSCISAVVILWLLAGGVAWYAYDTPKAIVYALSGKPFCVTPTVVDAQDVQLGSVVQGDYTVLNFTASSIHLVGSQTSCGCAVVENLPIRIPPYGRAVIHFKVLTPSDASELKYITETARLYMDVASAPQTIMLKARLVSISK